MNRKINDKSLPDVQGMQDSFVSNMEAIVNFVENVGPVVTEYDEKVSKTIEKAKQKIIKILGPKFEEKQDTDSNREGQKDRNKERVVEEAAEGVIQILGKYNRLPRMDIGQVELLYRSAFVLLNAFLDYLIHDVISCYYESYPQSLSEKDKELTIDLSSLSLCSDIDDAVDMIIEKKVDSITYKNLMDQKRFLKEYLSLDLRESVVNWDIINEAVERRNVIIHNECVVNRRYLRSVELTVIPEGKRLKEGDKVVVNSEYFTKVHEEIFMAGVLIAQSCWRKWQKEELEEADASLIQVMYRQLLEEKWHLVEKLGYASKDMETKDVASRWAIDINYCQALKWQGKEAELQKEISAIDESSLSPKFKACLAALKGNRDDFYKYAEQAVMIDELDNEAFDVWPLFRELRQDAEYKDKIKAILSRKSDN